MKAWTAVLVLSLTSLVACGSSKELTQAQREAETLRKENAKLKTQLTELENNIHQVRKERDQLKVAAAKPAPAPTPAPAPAKKTTATTRK